MKKWIAVSLVVLGTGCGPSAREMLARESPSLRELLQWHHRIDINHYPDAPAGHQWQITDWEGEVCGDLGGYGATVEEAAQYCLTHHPERVERY